MIGRDLGALEVAYDEVVDVGYQEQNSEWSPQLHVHIHLSKVLGNVKKNPI
jgi:hypothetical protein